MFERFCRFVAYRPVPVLLLTLGVTLFFGVQIIDFRNLELRLGIQTEVEKVLPTGGADREIYQEFVDRFGSYDMVFVGLTGADVFTLESLERIKTLTKRFDRVEGVRRVLSLSNAPGIRSEGGDVSIAAPFDEVPESPDEIAALRERVLSDAMFRGNLVSDDGRATALIVYPEDMSEEEFRTRGIDREIGRIAREVGGEAATVFVAGNPPLKATTGRILLRDVTLLVPLSYVFMAIIAFLSFHTLRGVAVPLLTIGAAQAWTMGTMVLFDRPLNLVTFIVPVLINAVGFAYAVHVVAEHEHALGEGLRRGEGARETIRREAFPVFLTAATTAAGFLSLCLSELPAIREFGAFCVVGVVGSMIAALTMAPALLSIAEQRGARPRGRSQSDRIEGLATRAAHFDIAHRRSILLVGSIVAAIAVFGLTRIEVSTSFVANLKEDNPVRVASDALDEEIGGSTAFHVYLRTDEANAFTDPTNLRHVHETKHWLEEQPEISKAMAITDYLMTVNRALRGGDQAAFAIPETQPAVSQILLFFWNDQLEELISSDYAAAHVLLRAPSLNSRRINELIDRVEARLAELPDGIEGTITGDTVLVGRTMDEIAEGQAASLSGAILIIYAILVLYFRSPRIAALALLPNALPVLVYFGVLGLSGVTLNIISSLIACIVLGIAVDDTIHFMVRFREQFEALGDEKQAVVAALRIVARPVTSTTVALCAGFMVLAASGLRHQVEFAVLSSCMLGFAWLVDVTFTPALCSGMRMSKRPSAGETTITPR